jgi:hypothetical protein
MILSTWHNRYYEATKGQSRPYGNGVIMMSSLSLERVFGLYARWAWGRNKSEACTLNFVNLLVLTPVLFEIFACGRHACCARLCAAEMSAASV